mmetsp:Transcript_36717/g.121691  ORF Transcript_36717/g.121691 Transcript_36717/m.121691 type:complete len:200 (-) Transcript_36717:427-1026(-)
MHLPTARRPSGPPRSSSCVPGCERGTGNCRCCSRRSTSPRTRQPPSGSWRRCCRTRRRQASSAPWRPTGRPSRQRRCSACAARLRRSPPPRTAARRPTRRLATLRCRSCLPSARRCRPLSAPRRRRRRRRADRVWQTTRWSSCCGSARGSTLQTSTAALSSRPPSAPSSRPSPSATSCCRSSPPLCAPRAAARTAASSA